MTTLAPYQKDTVEIIKKYPRVGILHDCGLGKTLCTFEGLKQLELADKTIWITKASLVGNVQKEWDKHYPNEEFPFVVRSFHWFLKESQMMKERDKKFSCVVLDESQMLKNWEAAMTRNILLQVANRCQRVIFLTATPYIKSAADLHPMLSVMEPGKWGKIKAFKLAYCEREVDPREPDGWKYFGINEAGKEVLGEALKRTCVRYTRDMVELQLPAVVHSSIYLDLDGKKTLVNKTTANKWAAQIAEGNITDEIKTQYQLTGIEKHGHVVEWMIDGDTRPSIVFGWHKKVVNLIAETLTGFGWKVGLITGETTQERRLEIVQEFQDGKLDCIAATLAAFGEGFNANRARTVVFAEGYWNYSSLHQGYSRAVRLDTKHSVHVVRLIAAESIDEVVYRVADSKKDSAKSIGLGFTGA